MAKKPKLTDMILKQFATLTIINERFRNMEKQNPEVFREWGEELQRRYLSEIKPVLESYAQYFPQIKSQMEFREQIYKKQISKE
jgi:hypothetical protein